MSILKEIVKRRQEDVRLDKKRITQEELASKVSALPATRDFRGALAGPDISLIAEVKGASPSKGVIASSFSPAEVAGCYQRAGADALSVLTEKNYFQGRMEYLRIVKRKISLPVLCKDFIFDPYQLYQARYYGADAVLLIAAVLEKEKLNDLYRTAYDLDLDVLVEVHSREELEEVLTGEVPDIIGINNRDLHSFQVDLKKSLELGAMIPAETLVVSESGIKNSSDVEGLVAAGIDAMLVGEALMSSPDPVLKIEELLSSSREVSKDGEG